jgi:hypothetical protein
MEALSARESSIKWWNRISDKWKQECVVRHGDHPPRHHDNLTGREIEAIWVKCGNPSPSDVFGQIENVEDLLGRCVELIAGGRNGGTTFHEITSVTKFGFRISQGIGQDPSLYSAKNGKLRGSGEEWYPEECRLVTVEYVLKESRAKRELARAKKAREAILHEVNSNRPTIEQLEAACKALGLVDVK